MNKIYRFFLLFGFRLVLLVSPDPILAQGLSSPASADEFDTRSTLLASETPPYPPSPRIAKIRFIWDTHVQEAPGSDLWPTTWGPDDNLYTSWGDGGGFGGTNNIGRVSLGFARIEGSPSGYKGVNIWGGRRAENPAQFTGKAAGIVSIAGVLYAWIGTDTGRKLGWSTNLAASWTLSTWQFSNQTFVPFSILNFGKDYAGARDNYVYSYGHEWGGSKNAYLIRAPKDQLKDKAAYEFFTGLGAYGQPTWSNDINLRKPVFSDPSGTDNNMSPTVVYNAGLNRYLLTMSRGGPQKLAIFDAPQPWGPWTTAAYYDNWGGFTGAEALLYSFPTKWISANGLSMWMIFSSTGNLDSFNLVKARIILK